MSDATRAARRDRSSCRWSETSRVPQRGLIVLTLPTHPRRSATFATLPSALLSGRARRRIDTFLSLKAPRALSALLRLLFRLPYYRAGRYASQGGYALT